MSRLAFFDASLLASLPLLATRGVFSASNASTGRKSPPTFRTILLQTIPPAEEDETADLDAMASDGNSGGGGMREIWLCRGVVGLHEGWTCDLGWANKLLCPMGLGWRPN